MHLSMFVLLLSVLLALSTCLVTRIESIKHVDLQTESNGVTSDVVVAATTPKVCVVPPFPTFTTMSPSSGSICGGYDVVLNGANFVLDWSKDIISLWVQMPDLIESEATLVLVTNSTIVYQMVPSHNGVVGNVSVRFKYSRSCVCSERGHCSGLSFYVFYQFNYTFGAPTITSVNPSGSYIEILGSYFGCTLGSVSLINNVVSPNSSSIITTWSDSRIVVQVPLLSTGFSGIWGLYVVSPSGKSSAITYYSYPIISAQDPVVNSLSTADNVTFVVAGSNFGATQGKGGLFLNPLNTRPIKFNLILLWSDTKIVFQNDHGVGSGFIVVLTNGGFQSAQNAFHSFSPIVAQLSQSYGSTAGGDLLTITGSTFTTAAKVKLIGLPQSYSLICDQTKTNYTSIICKLPAAVAGDYVVVVTLNGVSSSSVATPSNTFTYVSCSPKLASNPGCSCVITAHICRSVVILPWAQPSVGGSYSSGTLTLSYRVNQTESDYTVLGSSYLELDAASTIYKAGIANVNPPSITSFLSAAWDAELPDNLGCACF